MAALAKLEPKMKHAVLLPVVMDSELDVSIHLPPPRLHPELRRIFGSESIDLNKLLIIPYFRKTTVNLVGIGSQVEEEKDRQLKLFHSFAEPLCSYLKAKGHFADYTDPVSGFPQYSERCVGTYPDVLGAQMFLKYECIAANCCTILEHPLFGTSVYPATVFTTAPAALALEALQQTVAGFPSDAQLKPQS